MAKRRRFTRTQTKVRLFAAPGPLNAFSWKTIRRISREQGCSMVDRGDAVEVRDGEKLVGYRLRRPGEAGAPRESAPGKPGISAEEIRAAAGLHGMSITAGIDDDMREYLVAKGLPEMDFVEAATVKVAVYRSVH